MKDVQSSVDTRNIPLDRVGVRGLRYPIVVLDQTSEKQRTIADVDLSVSLPAHAKGTHMSRFVEILNRYRGEITLRTLPAVLEAMREHLEADEAQAIFRFPYFIEKAAPVSEATALADYDCEFVGRSSAEEQDFILRVKVPVTSLCPCSKEISDYGAHNQRGELTLEVRTAMDADNTPHIVWIEELVAMAEASASCAVYPLIKRADERYVTMAAYDNPVFVEDMVRNAALKLQDDSRVEWFRVFAENFESIHNHSAFAEFEWRRPSVTDAS